MVGEPGPAVLAVLTRAPGAGGKSRLFAGLGVPPDARLPEALLLDTLDAAAVPGVVTVAAVTPPEAAADVRGAVPSRVRVVPQPEGDLGARMSGLLAGFLGEGARAAAVIGSDLPELLPAVVTETFTVLARDPAALVLGPALDGGYYLIAVTRVPPVFEGVSWGGDRVLTETRAAAARAGLRVHLLPAVGDVDTPEDLRRAAAARPDSRTAGWLRAHAGRRV